MALDRSRLVRDSRQINIHLDQIVNRALAGTGLTLVQAKALLYMMGRRGDGTSVTALHQVAGYSKATISNLVKRLREKGYVQVEPCRGDDRRRLIFCTDKGRRIQGLVEGAIRDAEDTLYRDFSQQELAVLDRLQKKMLQNLSACQVHVKREA